VLGAQVRDFLPLLLVDGALAPQLVYVSFELQSKGTLCTPNGRTTTARPRATPTEVGRLVMDDENVAV